MPKLGKRPPADALAVKNAEKQGCQSVEPEIGRPRQTPRRVAPRQHGGSRVAPSQQAAASGQRPLGNCPRPGGVGAGYTPTAFLVEPLMNIVLVVLVLALLVGGGVGLVMGRKNINVGTLVGAWLVLVSAVGFIYLAGRVAERERAWRETIRNLKADLAATRGGPLAGKRIFLARPTKDLTAEQKKAQAEIEKAVLAAGGMRVERLTKQVDFVVVEQAEDAPLQAKEWDLQILNRAAFTDAYDKSLKGLTDAIAEKRREQLALETWRNRHWKATFFTPPELEAIADKPGLYKVTREAVVELPLAGGGAEAPLNAGAELAIFNLNDDDESGFLGIFSVRKATVTDGTILEVTIDPLTTPDEHDRNAWDRWDLLKQGAARRPVVSVFEDLPSDRRMTRDALTALRGIEMEVSGDLVTTGGIEGMRREILLEMTTIARNTDSISQARKGTDREKTRKQETATALAKDRDAWKDDVAFAATALAKLQERTNRVRSELAETRQSIVEQRAEIIRLTSLFLTKMGRREVPTAVPGAGQPE